MKNRFHVAIIGYGKSGKYIHAPLIDACDGMKLHAVLKRSGPDTLPERPGVRVYRNVESLLVDAQVDICVITTPNHLHFPLARKALLAGKHVVIDKPFTVTTEEANSLIQLAHRQKRILTIFQNRRWDGDFLTIKKLIREKAVGNLVEVESRFDRFRSVLKPDAWKEQDLPGSGILYDLGPHLIDQAIQLFGKPDSIFAVQRSQRGGKTDDFFELLLNYETVLVRLRAGMLVLDESPRFVIRGDKGAFVKYGMDPQESALASGISPKDKNWGKEPLVSYGQLITLESGNTITKSIPTEAGVYTVFYENLKQTLLGEDTLLVPAEQALQTITLIDKAIESAKTGKITVLQSLL